jgi:hypothetical protein
VATKKGKSAKVSPAIEVTPELARVLEAPRDLELRRAYAASIAPDPLGEYVATATEMLTAPTPRYFELALHAEELFRAHRNKWSSEWGREQLFALGMYAGLPDLVHIEKSASAEGLARLFGTCPIHELRLRNAKTDDVKTVVKVGGCARVRSLILRFDIARAGKALKDCLFKAEWPKLESVRFGDSRWDDAAQLLAALPALRRVSGAAIPRLEKLPQLGQLEHVGGPVFSTKNRFLADEATNLRSLGAAVFLNEEPLTMPSVRQLVLGNFTSGAVHCFPNLTELTLPYGPDKGQYSEADIDDLASVPSWENLESLAFGGAAASLDMLAQRILPRCRRLRHLQLQSAPCIPAILEALPELETLSIDQQQGKYNPPFPLDDEQLLRIAPYLRPKLRSLTLYGLFTLVGVEAVAQRATGLESVLFSANGFDAACVERLLAMPAVRRIQLLNYHYQSVDALRGQPSRGRYLGPSPAMTGSQREPIWTHELVAPSV